MSEQRRHVAHGSPVSSPVQSVQDPVRTCLAEGFREISASDAALAFFVDFDRRIANRRIVDAAQLSHGVDGVLRPAAPSPKNRGEDSSEGGGR